jgi:hypothetical protein
MDFWLSFISKFYSYYKIEFVCERQHVLKKIQNKNSVGILMFTNNFQDHF